MFLLQLSVRPILISADGYYVIDKTLILSVSIKKFRNNSKI